MIFADFAGHGDRMWSGRFTPLGYLQMSCSLHSSCLNPLLLLYPPQGVRSSSRSGILIISLSLLSSAGKVAFRPSLARGEEPCPGGDAHG